MAKGPNVARGRRGLRKLSSELIAQAQDQTAATITRIMLTFVGVALFCLLSLLTPDVALVTGGERLNVPFAGPVSFRGFMIVGPALMIVLWVYLQIYVEHWRRLEPIRLRLRAPVAPTVAPLENPLLRGVAGFVLYLLLPLTMLAFTWKASVLADWGAGLLCLTVAITAGHLSLIVCWPWSARALLAAAGAIFAATIVYVEGPLSRAADLFQADLSNQWLPYSHLRNANLEGFNLQGANLQGANLTRANLQNAFLVHANLEGANLEGADLEGAYLEGANFLNANLQGADLEAANLLNANLQNAFLVHANLEGANLEGALLFNAKLGGASLEAALLFDAKLGGAFLVDANLLKANLQGAFLVDANLEGANLQGANLQGANLEGANLEGAERLTQAQLDHACGDEATKAPQDLSVRTCAP